MRNNQTTTTEIINLLSAYNRHDCKTVTILKPLLNGETTTKTTYIEVNH